MCGFLTIVSDDQDRWSRCFERALETLAHRGPDAQGIWQGNGVTLGHRRLSVIDLPGGSQPMTSRDGRYHLVYNGELYNFHLLRRQLEGRGHTFATRSDTEVVLNTYLEWGVHALPRFDGMFGFAIWDDLERRLFVARDRVGVKPVFYSERDGFVCASTLAPFWHLDGFDRRMDLQAVRDYLAQGFFSPPRTILSSVRALEPGCWLRWDADPGRLEQGRYWDIPAATNDPMPLDDLVDATDAALDQTVKRQMVADVPLGVLFSGGIDSSLLTYYMTRHADQPVRTYTVKFDQSPKHDEAPIARRVAQKLGVDHHEYHAAAITQDDFRACIESMDQPFGDASYLPVVMLCRLARQQITVAIGGDGGDELFGGYDRYLKDESSYPPGPLYRFIRRGVEAGLLPVALYRGSLRGRDRVTRHFSRMGHYGASTRALHTILTHEAAQRFALDQTMRSWIESVLRWTGRMDRDSLMRADLWYFLSQNGLVKTDRASMACGLEARVPMLGNPVVDLIAPQPASTKLAHGLKTILMALAKRHLPPDAWDRPKRGFTVPVNHYLCHSWRAYCDHLIEGCPRIAPFLDAREVQRRWRLEEAGRGVDWPLYSIIVLLGWLEAYTVDF